ncbi:MAG TPA: ATP-grasp domain-containing protein [Candidatus Eremiobacteraceae bacterium]|nr:ATP-grasp domain-containing protein [Candidatus Eremiobacteraceae bacterium]
MSDPVSVLIPDGEYIFALSVLRCLGNARHRVSVCSTDKWAPARFSRFTDRFFHLDPRLSDAAFLDALLDVIKQSKADVLLPVGQSMLRFMLPHEETLRGAIAIVPIPSPPVFEAAKDKWVLAQFCQEHGLSHPQTIHFDEDPRFRERLASLRFPVLIKPARASYGRDIKYFKTAVELLHAVSASPPKRESIVQSFVPGYDIDFNVLGVNGVVSAYTIQRGIVEGHGRFKPPVGIDFVENEAIRAEAQHALTALRWSGVAHIDMRYDPVEGRAWIIEINPRFWASLLGSLVAGVNFPHLACIAATGAPMPPQRFRGARFVAGRSALYAIGARLLGDSQVGARFAETNLAFIAADPLPEILMGLTRPFVGSRRDRPKRRRNMAAQERRETF